MTLSGLTQAVSNLPQIASLRAAKQPVRVAGLLNAARPAVIAALHDSRQMLVVTAHPQTAYDLARELQRWVDDRVTHFPAIEALPYERVQIDRAVVSARDAVIHALARGEAPIVVAPVRALLQPVDAPSPALGTAESIETGAAVRPEELVSRWVAAGYAESRIVEEPGTFARRGGVLDIYPIGAAAPVRIDLFGNDVESLREFDPATQRSVAAVDSVRIPPLSSLANRSRENTLRELRTLDSSTLTAEAETRWQEDLAALDAGAGLDELAIFAPYLAVNPGSLVDHFDDNARVIIEPAQETEKAAQELCTQAIEVQQAMEAAGAIPHGLKPALLDCGALLAALRSRTCLEFLTGSDGTERGTDLTGLFTPAPQFAGRVREFVRTLSGRAERANVVATQQSERLAHLFTEHDVPCRTVDTLDRVEEPGVTVVTAAVAQGWALPAGRLTLFADYEVFGRSPVRPVPRRKRPAREAFFFDYAPGDYVVHLEHGIGRFEGVTRMTVEGAEREYAIVQYAGQDRVYVPTDQLERLTRYVGTGEAAPQLSKLGGGEWQRARARARAAAAEIAGELVELYARRRMKPAFAFSPDQPWQRELESSFAYEETPDQARAIEEVKADMEQPHPMDRLVCADVGYGKTEVAVRAAFKAVIDGKQVAVLAPTTVLAQQHFETFRDRYGAFPLTVEVLSRFRTPAQQKEILGRIASGEIDIVIGTHRLLQKDVHFKQLGLLIVDEEQRFGVRHKEQLKRWRESIDVLTLTATPIPRTLHSGLVGIREISVIETAPEGRLPIKTYLQPYDDRLVREAVLRELDRDGQVYIVHNKVATIEAMAARLRELVPEARVVVAHGQMEDRALEHTMLTFAHHEADVLLCSTIIENGLDIPNVNTIVVNNAHRLGLTQLYQLRGRVGRSANQAYAYLLYPLDARLSRDAARRMEAVFEAQDLGAGFTIAMKDLEIRGTGNLLGAEQSGHATAIGFDLYTRMIGDAVERLRGQPVQESPSISLNLPLTTLLPESYVGSEAERLTLYRRLADIATREEADGLEDEMRDRFGALPQAVQNLLTVVRLKLLAREARIVSIALDGETLSLRAEQGAMFDRVSLYRRYGMDARISNALLRIPRNRLGGDWVEDVRTILTDTIALHQALADRQPVPV